MQRSQVRISAKLQELNKIQRDRLAYVDLRLRFLGEIRRPDLIERFGIQSAAASRDLAVYRDLAPGNIDYDNSGKSYVIGQRFRPLFSIESERVMSWLTQSFSDDVLSSIEPMLPSVVPVRLTHPDLDTLACITRAIHQRHPVCVEYHSVSSGKTQREIVPFALFDTGLRWHVRAFDRKTRDFRDFVMTRIRQATAAAGNAIGANETSDNDIQWSRIVELEFVHHPDQPRPEITEMDYGMQDGVLKIRLRAATAGYILRKWSVDCSPDHRLRGPGYRLWLKDSLTLYGVKNAVLAPGYTVSTEER